MQIRKCNENDVRRVAAFYDKVVLHLTQNVNYPRWIYKKYPSAVSVKDAIQKQEQFVYEKDGMIVGAFALSDDPEENYENVQWRNSLKRGDFLVIHTLAVDPELCGQDVGKKMTAYCIDYAKKKHYAALRLDVVPENIPARHLYEKMGFQLVGIADLHRKIGDVPEFALYELNF